MIIIFSRTPAKKKREKGWFAEFGVPLLCLCQKEQKETVEDQEKRGETPPVGAWPPTKHVVAKRSRLRALKAAPSFPSVRPRPTASRRPTPPIPFSTLQKMEGVVGDAVPVLHSSHGFVKNSKTTTYCTHVESDELITSPHTIPRNFHPSRTHTRVVVSDGVARQNRTQGGAATLSDGVVLLVGGHRMWMLHRTQTGWS